MKTNTKYVISSTIAGLAVVAACFGQRLIITPPTIVVSAPPPVVVSPTPVVAPDYYAWDGYEYVGIVNGQYYYLGPGNVWIVMDSTRLHRFQGWQRGHPDWRSHATHNILYRDMNRPNQPHTMPNSSPAHGQPMHAQPQHAAPPMQTQPEHGQPQHAPASQHYPPQ